MPHMSNLNWLPLFIIFNLIFVYSLSFTTFFNIMWKKANQKSIMNKQKWQW